MIEHQRFTVSEASHPGAVRRAASALVARLGGDAAHAGRAALIATELTTNVLKHAARGEVHLYGQGGGIGWAVSMVAIDQGPGMRDMEACLADGMSTAGSPGTGLGAIRRLANRFDICSSTAGTVVLAEMRVGRTAAFEVGALRVPHPGEAVCGDDYYVVLLPAGPATALVVGGLGHGLAASSAAEMAVRIFRARPQTDPVAALQILHDALRATRGAAAAVATLDRARGTVRFAGIGNVQGVVVSEDGVRHMVSHHGTLGHRVHRIQEFSYPMPRGALVLLHSDGISSRWDLGAYPGLARQHPALVAGVLYRDFARRTDDASVVTVREAVA